MAIDRLALAMLNRPMHRLSRTEIETLLFVALKRIPRTTINRLRSLPGESDKAANEIAAMLAAQMDGNSVCVVRADTNPKTLLAGRFGTDEPWPDK